MTQNADATAATLDLKNQSVIYAGRRVQLTPKAFAVLHHLRANAGQLVTKAELLDAVWPNVYVGDGVLKVAVREIRQALHDNPRTPDYIETVHRRGYRLIGALAVDAVATAPAASALPADAAPPATPITPTPFCGRADELMRLDACWAQAEQGRRQVVLIRGEAGIGKSALVDGWLRRSAGRPRLIARGQCLEQHAGGEAYLPFLDALGRLCHGGADADALRELLARRAPTWLCQLPWLSEPAERERLHAELFGSTRERMLRELAVFVEALPTPLVLVLEDLHWSDYASVDLLNYLAWRDEPARLLLLATLRPPEPQPDSEHPLYTACEQLLRRGRGCELTPGPLDAAALRVCLQQRFGDAGLVERIAAPLHRLSGGQPLFLRSLVEQLIDSGRLSNAADDGGGSGSGSGWRLTTPLDDDFDDVPPDLRQLLDQQLRWLGPELRQTLLGAAVAGSAFAAAAVAAALDADPLDVEDRCNALARHGQWLHYDDTVVWPDGTASEGYRFVHDLYRRCCYDTLSAGRRQHYHHRLAERLRRGFAANPAEAAVELAYHYEHGGDAAAAVGQLEIAADSDAGRYALKEAAQKLDHALRLLTHGGVAPPARRAALLQRRSDFYLACGRLDAALSGYRELAAQARADDDPARLTEALIGQGHALFWSDRERCLQTADAALEQSRRLDDALLGAHARGWCAHWQNVISGYRPEHDGIYEQAVAAARAAGAADLQCQHLALHAYLLTLRARYADACRTAAAGLALAERTGNGQGYLSSRFFEVWALYYRGRWGDMRRAIDDGLAMADRNDHRLWQVHLRLQRAWLDAQTGRVDAVRALCKPLLTQADAAGRFGSDVVLSLLLLARADLADGRGDDVDHYLRRIAERLDRTPYAVDWVLQLQWQLALAECRLAQRRPDAARAAAQTLADQAAGPMELTHYGLAQALLAEAALAEDDPAAADAALRQGLQALADGDAPLAMWRLQRAAGRHAAARGERAAARRHGREAAERLRALAASLDGDDDRPLREGFLAQRWVVEVLDG